MSLLVLAGNHRSLLQHLIFKPFFFLAAVFTPLSLSFSYLCLVLSKIEQLMKTLRVVDKPWVFHWIRGKITAWVPWDYRNLVRLFSTFHNHLLIVFSLTTLTQPHVEVSIESSVPCTYLNIISVIQHLNEIHTAIVFIAVSDFRISVVIPLIVYSQ